MMERIVGPLGLRVDQASPWVDAPSQRMEEDQTATGSNRGEEHVGTDTLNFDVVAEIFLLLLIGIGPKIALVPYVELTKDMDKATKAKVMRKMLTTAGSVGLILVVLGEFLARLLHFSTGSLSIAGASSC